MKTKTFKIGEYCKGGIITAEVQGKVITLIGKDWDFSAGSRKSSNQSNAKEFTRATGLSTELDIRRKMRQFLEDLSTPYYADQVIKWVESKVELEPNGI